jgi:hypothetical protein
MRPTVSLPPWMVLTSQIVMAFVPPEMEDVKSCSVTTLTETVAGEMVTLMLVTGSVQVEEDAVLVLEGVFVVHVMAVLAGAVPQEVMLRIEAKAMAGANKEKSKVPSEERRREIPGREDFISDFKSQIWNFRFEISDFKSGMRFNQNPAHANVRMNAKNER